VQQKEDQVVNVFVRFDRVLLISSSKVIHKSKLVFMESKSGFIVLSSFPCYLRGI